jgi:hypothetical protein
MADPDSNFLALCEPGNRTPALDLGQTNVVTYIYEGKVPAPLELEDEDVMPLPPVVEMQ